MCKYFNTKTLTESAINSFKSGINHVIFAAAFILYYLGASSYYNNSNFDLLLCIQQYIVFLSLVCIAIGLLKDDNRLIKLTLIALSTLLMSLTTILSAKIANSFINYFYMPCYFLSIFMFLQQIKLIACFIISRNPKNDA